jgi:Fe-S-cluster containining protein
VTGVQTCALPICLSRHALSKELSAAAAAYQAAEIVPHCTQCSKPCCGLESLVLELEWKQIKSFWQLDESRNAFDKRLANGKGPEEIRAGNGLYYAHGKACPAYDTACGTCKVYGQDLKPVGCTDFPVYEDGGCLVADLRCEAVDLKALTTRIARAVGNDYRIVQSADREFPFLVTLSLKAGSAKPKRTG